MKFRNILYIISIAIFLAALIYSGNIIFLNRSSSSSDKTVADYMGPYFQLEFWIIPGLQEGFSELFKNGTIKDSEIEQLDFSQSYDTADGGSVWNVWNPNGKVKWTSPKKGPYIDQSVLDGIQTHSTPPVFNLSLYHQDNSGEARDVLFLILPNATEDACIHFFGHYEQAGKSFKIAPDNHNLVVDPETEALLHKSKCIRSQSGDFYLFFGVAKRTHNKERVNE